MINTPENIESLSENEIFIFGSNLNGHHGGGAARLAYEKFGAEWGVGEGITGQSYAFPTLDKNMRKVLPQDLRESVSRLYEFCDRNKDKTLFLTKVGCGIAGFPEDQIKRFFENSPINLVKPLGW